MNQHCTICPFDPFNRVLEVLEAEISAQNSIEWEHPHALREDLKIRIFDQRECDSSRADGMRVQVILKEFRTQPDCTSPTTCPYHPEANTDDVPGGFAFTWCADADGMGDPPNAVES